jgi:hypothetical protein
LWNLTEQHLVQLLQVERVEQEVHLPEVLVDEAAAVVELEETYYKNMD